MFRIVSYHGPSERGAKRRVSGPFSTERAALDYLADVAGQLWDYQGGHLEEKIPGAGWFLSMALVDVEPIVS